MYKIMPGAHVINLRFQHTHTGAIGGGTIAAVFLASLVILCIVVALFRRSARTNKGIHVDSDCDNPLYSQSHPPLV